MEPRKIRRKLDVTLVTPAFLGGADQSGEWRVPPFKALLRQWYRVAVAKECGYDYKAVREREGWLLGHAWLSSGEGAAAASSRVRLSLGKWHPGQMDSFQAGGHRVRHPEVTSPNGREMPIDPALYLGYGPLVYNRDAGGTSLKKPPALAAGSKNLLGVESPAGAQGIAEAIDLLGSLGAVGGRSRNGWGSIHVRSELSDDLAAGRAVRLLAWSRPLRDCLRLEWPHALGLDERGLLVWRSHSDRASWDQVMKELAEVKIAFRTALPLSAGRGGPFEARHLLSYPVTNHSVGRLENQARLANQIRFKVIRMPGEKFRALVFHLPTAFPEAMGKNLTAPERAVIAGACETWRRVHAVLDQKMERLAG